MPRRYTPNPRARLAFLGLLAIWVVLPVLMVDRYAQDALPFVTAGDLVSSHPGDVYRPHMKTLYDVSPRFATTSCHLAPAGTKCDDVTVGYVSTPQALPLSRLLGALGPSVGTLLMRLIASLSLAGGMWLLWQRLATRTRDAGTALAVTAAVLTPMAMVPLGLGQNSPLLFLSACLGISDSGKGKGHTRAAAVALVWVASVSFKAFPIALVLLLLWHRRGKVVAWAVAIGVLLTGFTAVVGPTSLYSDFLHATHAVSGLASANRFNGSIEAALRSWSRNLVGGAAFGPVYLVTRLGLVGGLWWWRVRHADVDAQWAWAWVAVLLFVPLVWWHYLFVAIAAIGLAMAGRRRLPDRLIWVLPAFALGSALISVPYIRDHPLPVAQAGFLLAAVLATTCLMEARPAATTAAVAVSDPDPAGSRERPQPAQADR